MKKISSLMMALVMCLVVLQPSVISAFEEVEPRAAYYYCATCDESKLVTSNTYEYTAWATQSTTSCQHGYDNGTDVSQYRYRYDIVKLQCGHSFRTGTKVKQTRTQCNGFD